MVVCLGWFCLVTAVMAQPFTLEASYTFGQQLDVRVSGQTAELVDSATLFLQAPEFAQTYTIDQTFAPTSTPNISQTVQLNQLQLAPFTTLTYWWVFHTPAGEDIRTPEAQLRYEDDQFVWRTVADGRFTVHWTGEENGLGQTGLDIAHEGLARVQALVPFDPTEPIDIYLYPTSADLRAALRLTGRDWVGAHASPELGVILVTVINPRTAPTDLRQSLPHELMHLALYQLVGDDVPHWFNEGLATHVQALPPAQYERLVETAKAEQAILDFATLCQQFPADEQGALLAYAQSAELIAFIEGRYGQRAIQQMVAALQDGAGCETAVLRTLNLTLPQLQQTWLGNQPATATKPTVSPNEFWLNNGFWLLLLLGGFGIMGLLIRSNK